MADHMTSGVRVWPAVEQDLPDIKRLADSAKQSLGFVHRESLRRAILRDEVIIAKVDETMIGFCHFYRRQDRTFTIYHIAVEPASQHSGVGRRLIGAVVTDAQEHQASVVRLKCPMNLEANGFYRCVGFAQAGVETREPRHLVLWELLVADAAPADTSSPQESSIGGRDAG